MPSAQANTPGLTPAVSPVVIDLDAGQRPEEPGTGSLTAARHAAAGPRLVLIVDQFEEVFTQCTDEHERRTFVGHAVRGGRPSHARRHR